MQRGEWVPPDVDISVPSISRTYDYLLGGAHNFAADRAVGERIEAAMPGLRAAARVNRAFLARVVRHLVARGVRQFLDIGSGIPTVGNVHEVAQARAPECRVLYVDRDPVAVAHSELILVGNDRVDVVPADLRDPAGILADRRVRRLLDLDEPVGLLMLLVLHWVPDEDDPAGLVARYRDALAPGSWFAMTHVTADEQGEELSEATDVIRRSRSRDQVTLRSRAEIADLFAGFDLVEPGLVGCAGWRPGGPADMADESDMNVLVYAGVGRKA
ncbi:SAM-dependent methyltransferase [Saccharothrix sp. BKS2]|uniref:SAM-dependent methyltransferase n=1 Tax=Saccharothrix sp. BKS2 TaxID=3064400 RepID=UPI0039E7E7CE